MTRDILSAITWSWRDSHLLVCSALDGVLTELGEAPGDVRLPTSRRADSGMTIRFAPYLRTSSATRFSMEYETMPRAVARLDAMASTASRSAVRPLRWASARKTSWSSQRRLCMLSFQNPYRLDQERPAKGRDTAGYGDSKGRDDGSGE